MNKQYEILEIIKSKKRVSVEELCDRLYCSPATIRRELNKLEKTEVIKRVRGGAVLVGGTHFDYSASYRVSVNVKAKEYISDLAKDFISSGMSVFLDSSSTVEKIFPYLEAKKNITVITNGIGIAIRLNESNDINTYLTGGHLEEGSLTVTGELAGNFIKGMKADLTIISCRGIDDSGVFEANNGQAQIKKHMIQNTKKVILLCDSSKFGYSYLWRLCDFGQLEAVITDKKPEDKICRAISESGCEVIY